MNLISFAWTTPALLAGAKTCTRRDWTPDYANHFKAGDVVSAFDRNPRNSGKKVAEIRLLNTPVLESTLDMPASDYQAEGFAWLYGHADVLPAKIFGAPCSRDDFSPAGFNRWRQRSELLYVVRFALVRVMPGVRTIW